jgi:hypothetical protein
MRPQDIVILLKIISWQHQSWLNKDLARALFISPSEISDSLNRSAFAGLLDVSKKKVHRLALMEFLEHGLHYVFPAIPGTMVNGFFTAHSHPHMQQFFSTDLHYVWNDPLGDVRGLSIEPLYPQQVKAARQDDLLYLALALLDVIRVGRVRELMIAIQELKKIIL